MKTSENSRSPSAMMYNRKQHGCVSRKEAVLRRGGKGERKDQQNLLWWRGDRETSMMNTLGLTVIILCLSILQLHQHSICMNWMDSELDFLFPHQSCLLFGYLGTSVEPYINAHLLTLQQSSVQAWSKHKINVCLVQLHYLLHTWLACVKFSF